MTTAFSGLKVGKIVLLNLFFQFGKKLFIIKNWKWGCR
jgi:hypothetical protein